MRDDYPNYLNMHNIDPARIEPVRIDTPPGNDSIRPNIHPHDFTFGPVPVVVKACVTPYMSKATDMYKELCRRKAKGGVACDCANPGKVVTIDVVHLTHIYDKPRERLVHVIEVYGVSLGPIQAGLEGVSV